MISAENEQLMAMADAIRECLGLDPILRPHSDRRGHDLRGNEDRFAQESYVWGDLCARVGIGRARRLR